MLQELITSGRIVDIMLAFVVLEVALLLGYRQITGRGIAPRWLLINIGAGGSLMLALRAVFVEADWKIVAACLIAALVFHVADLAQRWRGAPSPD
ncbi:MAG: hypothetical protein AAFX56_16935 [Pseudomonadota bacterium]